MKEISKQNILIVILIPLIWSRKRVEGKSKQEITFCHENAGMLGIRRCHHKNTGKTFLSVTGGKIHNINDIQHLADFNLTAAGVEICTNGVWALYTEPNYEKGHYASIGSGGLCYVCPQEEDQESCNGNFGTKSARYMGNMDSNLPGLSLYRGDGISLWPTGRETYIDGKIKQVSFNSPVCVAFWGFTNSPGWTIYSDGGFKGESACLMPKTLNGSTLAYGWGELNYYYVGSVQFGCSSKIINQVLGIDESFLTMHNDGSIIQESNGDEDHVYDIYSKRFSLRFSSCKNSFSKWIDRDSAPSILVQKFYFIFILVLSIIL